MAHVANERKKALDLALSQIEKNFGKGAIMKMGQDKVVPIETIPTGSILRRTYPRI